MEPVARTSSADSPALEKLRQVIRRHWGFSTLRPLQDLAMEVVLAGRDSLLVLPTGGGKSLCYQAPAVVRGDTTVVISPLISLMKDQVDALGANGVSAVGLNSGVSPEELRQGERAVLNGSVRLLFASPERLATESFRGLLRRIGVKRFVIDEAHCISHWGHDFRPEYRQLSRLKELFPEASVHAFTATATEQVRADIVSQLGLHDPQLLVGDFDRPNLTYRVVGRDNPRSQVLEVIRRHPDEAGIVYCIRRRDVDDLTAALRGCRIAARPYHAGMTPEDRKATQDAFREETCNLVVATVAFGMGIDRSNIRYVVHTGMPKSIEHYQQETGRAGRDGLEAECVLLYSGADAMLWKNLVAKSVDEAEVQVDPQYIRSAHQHIAAMEAYCRPIGCRHRSLVQYFGQAYQKDSCQACDLCLDETDSLPDAQTVAKKILSCVARVDENFPVNYVVNVLRGESTPSMENRGHQRLSTFGLLREHKKSDIRVWIHELLGQNLLTEADGDYPALRLTAASWDAMNDRRKVRLRHVPASGRTQKKTAPTKRSKTDKVSWEGVDRSLFDALRQLRRQFATQRGVPPYVVFGDATLRELARVRPSTIPGMQMIYGIGQTKLGDFGESFLKAIDRHCRLHNLSRDNVDIG